MPRVELEVSVVDDAAAWRHLVNMAGMAWIVFALGGIAEEGFLVQGDQHVDLVNVGMDRHRRRGHAVIAVLAHDVRVEFDVREYVKAAAAQRLGIDLGRGVDTPTLGAAKDPGKFPAAEFSWHYQR